MCCKFNFIKLPAPWQTKQRVLFDDIYLFTLPAPRQIKQRVLFNNLCSRCLLSDRSSPWYNRNGWLGVKHQVLPTDQTKGISQQRFFIHLLRNAYARMPTPHAISTLIFVPQFRLTCRSPGRRHPQRGWPACTRWGVTGRCSAERWVGPGSHWIQWSRWQSGRHAVTCSHLHRHETHDLMHWT